MAEITVEESWRQVRALTDRAEQAMGGGRPDEAVDRWRAVLAHRCAHHQVVAHEILDEVHRAYREAGHYDDAIAAKHEAIAVGYRSVPDPEADIAECLLDAGQIEEADALFATLRERDPEDVWLYNAAAYSHASLAQRSSHDLIVGTARHAHEPDVAGVVARMVQEMRHGVLERLVDQESHAV